MIRADLRQLQETLNITNHRRGNLRGVHGDAREEFFAARHDYYAHLSNQDGRLTESACDILVKSRCDPSLERYSLAHLLAVQNTHPRYKFSLYIDYQDGTRRLVWEGTTEGLPVALIHDPVDNTFDAIVKPLLPVNKYWCGGLFESHASVFSMRTISLEPCTPHMSIHVWTLRSCQRRVMQRGVVDRLRELLRSLQGELKCFCNRQYV